MTQKAPVPTLMSRLTRIAPLVALSCLVASGLEASEIAHWKFDGDLLDSSGNGYDLSVGAGSPSFSNATPPNITSSSSVYLNGSAQLTHLLATPLSLSSAYSIAAWIKAPQPGPSGGYPGMFSLGKAGVGSDVEVYLQQINNDLVIQHNQGNGGSLDWTGVDYPSSVGGVWLHVALTYDSSLAAAQQYKIYFNGTVQTKTQNAPNIGFPEMTPPVMSSPQTISVGKLNHNAFGPNFFNGLVDEMYVFNHALSVAEIGMLVPEPSVMAFLGLGGLLLWRRHPC